MFMFPYSDYSCKHSSSVLCYGKTGGIANVESLHNSIASLKVKLHAWPEYQFLPPLIHIYSPGIPKASSSWGRSELLRYNSLRMPWENETGSDRTGQSSRSTPNCYPWSSWFFYFTEVRVCLSYTCMHVLYLHNRPHLPRFTVTIYPSTFTQECPHYIPF